MKTKMKIAVFYLTALILGGCLLPSLHPLYTDEDLVFEEKLIGKWLQDDGSTIWQFKPGSGKSYELRVFDGKEGRFQAHLLTLEDFLFLDLFPAEPNLKENDFYKWHLLPVHTFMAVDQLDPNLHLRAMNPEPQPLKDDPNLLKSEHTADRLVLTAPTEELQQFVIEYINTEGVFDNPMSFTRLEPLYTDEDLFFDEKLLGQWSAENGEMLDIIQAGEKTYDIIYLDEAGAEFQFTAHLAKLKSMMLVGVFFGRPQSDPNDPYDFHLIPDILVKAELRDSTLRSETLDYNELAEVLQNNPNLLTYEVPDPETVFEKVTDEY